MSDSAKHLKTDGTDFHVKPRSDRRHYDQRTMLVVREERACSLCGFPEDCGWPHRKHPDGGWETVQGHLQGQAIMHYVPPETMFEAPNRGTAS